ncbi:MAG: hypothetical protein JSV18_02805 [Candidatus Bathyarchaeota archaeon]|nr:MAG: hypothetical protein JSV18_02805 [Candidatus Bathyarchaeota archaeon]
MGHIAAVLSKDEREVFPALSRILQGSDPRDGESYGVASDRGVIIGETLEAIDAPRSKALLGHILTKTIPLDQPQLLYQYNYTFTFLGRLWYKLNQPNVQVVADGLGRDPEKGLRQLIEDDDGSFASIILSGDSILFGRDPMGTVPLYYGESQEILAVASCKKMLWSIGLEEKRTTPGHIYKATRKGISSVPIRIIAKITSREISMGEAVGELDRILSRAVETRCHGLSGVSLGFSGGIDSSLIAYYINKAGVEVDLICVGMEGSREFSAAEKAAESLDLPLRLESFTMRDVEEAIDEVLWSIEDPTPLKVAVALPLHWTSKLAAESGIRVIFSGNGSDEIFGGYHRYFREYVERGESVRDTMYRDVLASHEINFERDYKISLAGGLELRLPFADLRLVEWGLALPVELKLPRDLESQRKLILRSLAKKLGFPDEISSRRKRAVQYSTGVNAALKKCAKKKGKTLDEYLSDKFAQLKNEMLGGHAA